MKKPTFTSVRLRTETREKLDVLIERLVRVGWNAVGADRTDAPGIASVLDFGLVLLEEKLDDHAIGTVVKGEP